MASSRKLALAVLLVAMIAVAAAYDPIADSKVPSPKSPVQPSIGAGRKMLQWGGMGQQAGLFGPYYVGHPFWVPGLRQSPKTAQSEETSIQRRFDSVN